ncbi:hypothetical protein DRQ53_09140 [bacterium]|nr:MAG: hypothetical protein DRQ53_09140 [bacterium]
MKLLVAITMIAVLISLVASPALAQVSGGTADAQLQQKNHENTDPNYDGNGGINRHQTVGEPGPNGEDYGNFDESNKPGGSIIEQVWMTVNLWLIALSALH